MTVEVGVVGAGIIGLTTAVRIIESVDGVRVTVIAESLTPHTTADAAMGYFGIYLIDGINDEKLRYISKVLTIPPCTHPSDAHQPGVKWSGHCTLDEMHERRLM